MTEFFFQFRKAEESDLPFLEHLRKETMGPHIERTGQAYDEARQKERLLDRFDCAQIVLFSDRKIGLLKLDRELDPWMLMQIQIVPAFQKRGLGRSLLTSVLSDAQKAGVGVTLKVLKTNPAKRLYERGGFRVIEQNEHSFFMLCS